MPTDIEWNAPLPDCDICKMDGRKTPAPYDSPTLGGPWANMCQEHLDLFGVESDITLRRINA